MSGPAEQHRDLPHVPLPDLMARARAVRDDAHGRRVTFSPKVFIPLTMLCRDRCGYCTFAQPPARLESPYLTPEQVLAIARAGAAAGCHEALFTLGEGPEDRYPVARTWLAEHGYGTTIDYLAAMAQLVLDETGLLPHANAGALSLDDLATLRAVAPSQGMMIESLRDDLDCHRGAPDKVPCPPARHPRGSGPAPDPLHHRHPRGHRRGRHRSDRGARGDRRLPSTPRPRAGGDRPELPAEARHRDARRRPVPGGRLPPGHRPRPGDPAAARSTSRRPPTSPTTSVTCSTPASTTGAASPPSPPTT